jgi:hypothetical protein
MKKSQKHILCIGGGKDVPFLLKNIKQQKIILVDQNINNPSKKLCDVFINCSYYQHKKIIKFILKNKLKNKIQNIIFRTTGKITYEIYRIYEFLKLDFMPKKSAEILTFKNKLSNFCNKNKILMPKIYKDVNRIKKKNLPIFLRPALSSGKRGLKIIRDKKFLKKEYKNTLSFSENNKVLIEEFIEGRDIGLVGQCIKSKFRPTLLVEEIINLKEKRPLIKKLIGEPKVEKNIRKKCIEIANIITKKLLIKKSQLSLQFKLDKSNQVYLIETHINFPGDHILESLYQGFKKKTFYILLNNYLNNKHTVLPNYKKTKVYFYWKNNFNRKKYFFLKKIVKIND